LNCKEIKKKFRVEIPGLQKKILEVFFQVEEGNEKGINKKYKWKGYYKTEYKRK